MGRAQLNPGGRTLVSMTGVLATVTGELTCPVDPESDLGVSEAEFSARLLD